MGGSLASSTDPRASAGRPPEPASALPNLSSLHALRFESDPRRGTAFIDVPPEVLAEWLKRAHDNIGELAAALRAGTVKLVASERGRLRALPGPIADAFLDQQRRAPEEFARFQASIPDSLTKRRESLSDHVLMAIPSAVALGRRVGAYLGVQCEDAGILHFADGELKVHLPDVRNKDVTLIAATSDPGTETLLEVCQAVNAAKTAKAKNITVLFPYFGFARQDRKDEDRTCITAKLVCKFVGESGADHIILTDPHSPTVEGFPESEDTLFTTSVLLPYLVSTFGLRELCQDKQSSLKVGGPDLGSVKRNEKAIHYLRQMLPGARIDGFAMEKARDKSDSVEGIDLLGEVAGATVILFDDLISTGGTSITAAKRLKAAGAKKVIVMAAHGVCSSNAHARLHDTTEIDAVVVTNSISQLWPQSERFHVVDISRLLAEAVYRNAVVGKGSVRKLPYVMLSQDPKKPPLELSRMRSPD